MATVLAFSSRELTRRTAFIFPLPRNRIALHFFSDGGIEIHSGGEIVPVESIAGAERAMAAASAYAARLPITDSARTAWLNWKNAHGPGIYSGKRYYGPEISAVRSLCAREMQILVAALA